MAKSKESKKKKKNSQNPPAKKEDKSDKKANSKPKKSQNKTSKSKQKKKEESKPKEKKTSPPPKQEEKFDPIWTILIFVAILALIFIAAAITFLSGRVIFGDDLESKASRIEDSSKLVSHSKRAIAEVKGEENENNIELEEFEKDTTYTIDQPPAYEGAQFFEQLPQIEGEYSYIAHPLEIDLDNPPSIVIYSHGSITFVVPDMENAFMKNEMRPYGEYFTSNNYIFAASNQHGENWGSPEAVQDTVNLVQYIKENYNTTPDVYLIGFSMGGLPTWKYAFENPENVKAIALLAPTSYYGNYGPTQFEAIDKVPVTIWHGTADTNIDISISRGVVSRAALFGKEITLIELAGATHWDVDTELMNEILYLFESSK